MTKQATREVISEILAMIIKCPIPVRWRSQTITSGGGERRSRARGTSGHDVIGRVTYVPGDDPRDIDWAATAQTGGQTILVTQHHVPREINVFAVVDLSPTMDFGTSRTTKRLLTAELSGSVVKCAGKTQDRVGFIAYSKHRLLVKRTPTNARKALYPIVADVIETEAARDGEGSGLIKSLSSLPRLRSLVFIFSDFLSLTEAEKLALKRAALVHDVVCVVIQDQRERELPEGWGPYNLVDLDTGESNTIWLSDESRAQFAANAEHHYESLLADLKAAYCDTAVFSTEEGKAAIPKMMLLFGGHRR